MRKSLIFFTPLFILIGCSSKSDMAQEQARQDSIRIADSIAQVEAAQAAAEQARLDSIRQDSIANEEKMRIDPTYFVNSEGYSKPEELVIKYGFKLKKKETEVLDEENGVESRTFIYSRNFNNRRIDFESWYDTCSGVTIVFRDKIDFDNFIEDLIKNGFKWDRDTKSYINKNDIQIHVNGKKFSYGSCG